MLALCLMLSGTYYAKNYAPSGWVEGREEWVGVGGGEGGGKNPQVKTRGHQSPSDSSDHSTRLKGHHSGRG